MPEEYEYIPVTRDEILGAVGGNGGRIPAPASFEDDEYEYIPVEMSTNTEGPEEEPGFFSSTGRGLVHGTLGLAESAGTAVQYVGGKVGSETLEDWGRTAQQYWEQKREPWEAPESLQGSVVDKPSLLLKPAWWAYNVSDMIPSFAAAALPGIGTGKYIKMAGTALEWTPQAVARLAQLGAMVSGGTIGGALEGSQTYQEVLKKGGSREDAEAAMEMMTLASGALNSLTIGKMAKPGRIGAIKRFLQTGSTEALTEYLEEPAEVAIKMGILPRDKFTREEAIQQLVDGINVAFPAFITGGMGGAISRGDPGGSRAASDNEQKAHAFIEQVQANIANGSLAVEDVEGLRNDLSQEQGVSQEVLSTLDNIIKDHRKNIEPAGESGGIVREVLKNFEALAPRLSLKEIMEEGDRVVAAYPHLRDKVNEIIIAAQGQKPNDQVQQEMAERDVPEFEIPSKDESEFIPVENGEEIGGILAGQPQEGMTAVPMAGSIPGREITAQEANLETATQTAQEAAAEEGAEAPGGGEAGLVKPKPVKLKEGEKITLYNAGYTREEVDQIARGEIAKPDILKKKASKKAGPQNLVTWIVDQGGVKWGADYRETVRTKGARTKNRTLELHPDIKRTSNEKSGHSPDDLVAMARQEGYNIKDGEELFDLVQGGKAREYVTPGREDLLEAKARREEDEWIEQQLADLDDETKRSLEAEVQRESEEEAQGEVAAEESATDEERVDLSNFFLEQGKKPTLDDIYAESKTGPVEKKPEKQLTPEGYEKAGYEQVNLEGEAEPIFEKVEKEEVKPQQQEAMFSNILGQEVGNIKRGEGEKKPPGTVSKQTLSEYAEMRPDLTEEQAKAQHKQEIQHAIDQGRITPDEAVRLHKKDHPDIESWPKVKGKEPLIYSVINLSSGESWKGPAKNAKEAYKHLNIKNGDTTKLNAGRISSVKEWTKDQPKSLFDSEEPPAIPTKQPWEMTKGEKTTTVGNLYHSRFKALLDVDNRPDASDIQKKTASKLFDLISNGDIDGVSKIADKYFKRAFVKGISGGAGPVQIKQPHSIDVAIGKQAALGRQLLQEHKDIVQQALSEGLPVPRNVLEEYKDEEWAKEALGEKAGDAPVEQKLLEKRDRIQKKIDGLNDAITKSNETDMPGAFVTGASGVPASRKRTINKQLDRRIERAKEQVRLQKELESLDNQIKAQRNRFRKEEIEEGVKSRFEEQFESIQVGDLIDIGGNAPLRVVKKNQKTVVTDGGSKWTADEIGKVIPQGSKTHLQISEKGVEYTHENAIKEQLDLFGAVPARGRKAQHGATTTRSSLRRGPQPEVVSVLQGYYEGGRKATSAQEIAQIGQINLVKYPNEHLLSVITDKDHNIISILAHSAGGRAEAAAEMGIVAGQALNTKDAANVWLLHQHPSGESGLSTNDKNAINTLYNILDGTEVAARDMVCVTADRFSAYPSIAHNREIPPITKPTEKIERVERQFKTIQEKTESLQNPKAAIEFAKKSLPAGGIILTDFALHPVATYKPKNYQRLRGATQIKLLKEMEKRNAYGMFVVQQDKPVDVNNLIKFSKAVGLELHDVIDIAGSEAERRGYEQWIEDKNDVAKFQGTTFLSTTPTAQTITEKGVDELRGIAKTVRDIFNRSLPQEALERTSIELKLIIDLKGKNLRETVKQHGGRVDLSKVLGAATVTDLNALIELSYNHDAGTIKKTAYHEMYHVARRWLLTDEEISTMNDAFENEEAEAEAFATFSMDRKALPKETLVKRAFRRIKRVLNRIRNALKGQGYMSAEDVFEKLYEGGYKGVVAKPGESATMAAMTPKKGTGDITPKESLKPEGEIVYKDALGVPEPEATIALYGASYSDPIRGSYFSLNTTSDAPYKKWTLETPDNLTYEERKQFAQEKLQKIVKEMEAEGWRADIDFDGYGRPRASLIHVETENELNKLTISHNKKWEKAVPVYFRYGKLPPSGKSKNHADNRFEQGVSVFRGRLLPSGEIEAILGHTYEQGSFLMGGLQYRKIYVVDGEEIGLGSDGEPVLKNAKLLTPKQAARKLFTRKEISSYLHPNPSSPPVEGGETMLSVEESKPLPKFMQDFLDQVKSEPVKDFGTPAGERPPIFQTRKLNEWLKDESDAILKGLVHQLPKNQPYLNALEKVLASPEWYQHPEMQRLVRLFMRNRPELYHEFINYLNQSDTEDAHVIDETKALKHKGLNKWQIMKGESSEEYKTFQAMIEDGDTTYQRDKEKTLQEQMEEFVATWRQKGATNDVIRVWRLHRESYDKALDLMEQQMRDLIKQMRTQQVPFKALGKFAFAEDSTENEGRWHVRDKERMEKFVTATSETASKYYLPAEEGINYVIGTAKDGSRMVESVRFKKSKWDEEAARKWWDEHQDEIDITMRPPTPDSEQAMKTLRGMLASMSEWRGFYAPRIRTQGDWAVQAHRKVNGKQEFYREHRGSQGGANRLANHLERSGWTVRPPFEIPKVPEDIYQHISTISVAKAIEAAMGQAKTGENPELAMKFNESLIQHVSDMIKARGYRSSMIHRGTEEVVRGYVEDPLERHVLYLNNTCRGLAKAKIAQLAGKVIMGEFKDGEQVGGINPTMERRAYQVAIQYTEEQLRNTEQADRLIGLAKSVATFKFLGFNLRSLGVNLTAIATTAPAAIQNYALQGKGSFRKITTALGRAGKDYATHMRGRKLDNREEQEFMDEIGRKGYDDPQYTRDALGSIQRTHQKVWPAMMDASMYCFGKSEQWNRGTTMLAAYRLARKQGQSHGEAKENAKEASDRAHGVYGKATLPLWAMGKNPAAKVGQMMYVYGKFGHNYVQMLYDLGLRKHNIKAFTWAILSPMVLAGGSAFPFKDDIFALFGFILRKLGIKRDPEKWVWDTVRNYLGERGEIVARHGVTGALGVDISGSLSIGIGIPTGLADLTGPIGGVAEDLARAGRYLSEEQYGRALETVLPRGIENPLRALRERETGIVTQRGKRVWDERGRPMMPSAGETAARVAGFRSARQATLAERTWEAKRELAAFAKRRTKIYERYRAYLANPEKEEHKEIRKLVRQYNDDIKGLGVPRITYQAMRRQMRSMRRPTRRERKMLQ